MLSIPTRLSLTHRMDRFADFLKERLYLLNVSQKTITYYQCAFKAWSTHGGSDPKSWIVNMRNAGISPVSCNTYICALNAYWKWAGNRITLPISKKKKKFWLHSPQNKSRHCWPSSQKAAMPHVPTSSVVSCSIPGCGSQKLLGFGVRTSRTCASR